MRAGAACDGALTCACIGLLVLLRVRVHWSGCSDVHAMSAPLLPPAKVPQPTDPPLCAAPAAIADIRNLPYLRACLAESLRLYPQPPILIRRALGDDTLPPGLNGDPNGGCQSCSWVSSVAWQAFRGVCSGLLCAADQLHTLRSLTSLPARCRLPHRQGCRPVYQRVEPAPLPLPVEGPRQLQAREVPGDIQQRGLWRQVGRWVAGALAGGWGLVYGGAMLVGRSTHSVQCCWGHVLHAAPSPDAHG